MYIDFQTPQDLVPLPTPLRKRYKIGMDASSTLTGAGGDSQEDPTAGQIEQICWYIVQ